MIRNALGALDGLLLQAGDAGFDEARTVWNAMVDRHPRAIVRCASVADVVAAVRAARRMDLEIGVRCGGHSVVGHAVPDGGLMVDLTPLDAVRVDPDRRRALVRGGALLGALDRATQPYGLATTAGNVSHTGVGGLTLGGGLGWLARRFGLSCDNVESFEVVTADGRVVRASADEEPELFWGLRGGGGNFGVVTDFEFRLHDTGTRTLVVEYTFPLDGAAAVLRAWRDLSAEAPREATFTAFVGEGVAVVGYIWVGDPEQGRRLLPALKALGGPAAEKMVELSYVDLQRRDDSAVGGHAYRRYWKGHYLYELPDAAIDELVRHGAPGGLRPGVSLQAYGGAIADVPDDATAFSHRATRFEYVAGARWTDPAEDGERIAAARTSAAAIAPYASGAYVNTLADEGEGGVRRAYPPHKLARLAALKAAFDPDNVFHLNQNITPA